MKGISHFASGLAIASFFPWTIEAAQAGNPLFFILGGAMGILPDTLDFKFYRFFYKHDIYIEPDPNNPDPQAIANQLATAVGDAATSKNMIKVKLSTIRLGADFWQQYSVHFDAENEEVEVRFGPVVNTGQVPIPNSEPAENAVGRAKLPCKFVQTYDATTRVDIFDGPTFGFAADGNGGTVLNFLPWHREWTHSFTIGAVLGAIGWAIWDWRVAPLILATYAIHIVEDQLGFMGSNIFYPLTKKRAPGLHLMRSGDALPNFAAVWLSCLLIFWNLYRALDTIPYQFNLLQLLFFAAILPIGLFSLILHWIDRKRDSDKPIDTADEWGEKAMV